MPGDEYLSRYGSRRAGRQDGLTYYTGEYGD